MRHLYVLAVLAGFLLAIPSGASAAAYPPACSSPTFNLPAQSSTYLHVEWAASKLFNQIKVNSGFAPSNTRVPRDDMAARLGLSGGVQGCMTGYARADNRNVTVYVAAYVNGLACYYMSGVSGTDVSAGESPTSTTATETSCGGY